MAGSLAQVSKVTLSTPTASCVLTGIDSDHIYMATMSNAQPVTDNKNIVFHLTKSGSADTTKNYDHSARSLKSNTTFGTTSGTNSSAHSFAYSCGNGTGEKANAILYLYNFNDASEYSFYTVDSSWYSSSPYIIGFQGGVVHTVASASDGVAWSCESGVNFAAGTEFALYRVT